jgi:hypothetical protein
MREGRAPARDRARELISSGSFTIFSGLGCGKPRGNIALFGKAMRGTAA